MWNNHSIPKESAMPLRKSFTSLALPLLLVLGAGKASAINVLTFDGAVSTTTSFNALGFSVTSVSASDASSIDFSQYDVIYVSQTLQELEIGSLETALAGRAGDIAEFIAAGGGVVFGSPMLGSGSSGNLTLDALHPILHTPNTLDLSGLGFQGLPLSMDGPLNTVAVNASGDPVLVTGQFGLGRVVGWNPDPTLSTEEITQSGIELVDNSIRWAAGDDQPPTVPELPTVAMTALGLGGLIFVRRRLG
jgi:hypothetical protein